MLAPVILQCAYIEAVAESSRSTPQCASHNLFTTDSSPLFNFTTQHAASHSNITADWTALIWSMYDAACVHVGTLGASHIVAMLYKVVPRKTPGMQASTNIT